MISVLFYSLFLTLGTYAVPSLRIGGEAGLPYAVGIAVILAPFAAIRAFGRRVSLRITPAVVLVHAGYVLSLFIAVLSSGRLDAALSLKYATMSLFPVMAIALPRCVGVIGRASACLLVSSLGVFLYGLYGFVTGATGNLVEHSLGYFGITYEESTRNGDMMYVQTAIWLTFGLTCVQLQRRSWPAKVVSLIMLAVLLSGALLSQSRGTWIAVCAGGLALFVLQPRHIVRHWRACLGLAVIALVALGISAAANENDMSDQLRIRFGTLFSLSTDDGNSNSDRVKLVASAVRVILDHPFVGVGVGQMKRDLLETFGPNANHAENAYLQIFAEQGILGISSVLGMFLLIGSGLASRFHRATERNERALCRAVFGLVVTWAVYCLFNNLVESMWFWSVLGLAASLARCERSKESVRMV